MKSVVLLFAAALACAPLHGEPSFFYSLSMETYSSPALPVGEYGGAKAGIDLSRGGAGISIFLRGTLPYAPFDPAGGAAGLGIDIRPFAAKRHILEWLSPRRTHWLPSVGASILFPFQEPGDFLLEASLSPFRLYAGWGNISFLSLCLLRDGDFKDRGWGLGILEFSYYPRRRNSR